jgi:multiple antibiotic resistance protein
MLARMNASLVEYALLCFVSLFTMINPLSVLPIYVSMTGHLSVEETQRVALRSTLTAAGVLVFFAVTGHLVFRFFSVSVDSLRVVGGVILFLLGYEMMQARLSPTKHDPEANPDQVENVAITPIGVPIIAGPGAITSVILLMNDAGGWGRKAVLFLVIAVVLGITFAFLHSAKRVVAVLGGSVNKVVMRLMGLIVMMIAVEFFFAGLRPIVRGMLER